MNWKIATAFAAGAVIASGIVYMAVAPTAVPKRIEMPIVATPPPPQVVAKLAEVSEKPAVPAAVVPVAPAVVPTPTPAPAREKPSPVHREKPVTVARDQPQVQQPAPQPTPEPRSAEPAQPSTPAPPEPVPPPSQDIAPSAPPAAVSTVIDDATRPPESRFPNSVTLAAGTSLRVRIGETISSARHQPGDSFLATLDQPLVIDGFVIAERGSRLEGRVVDTGQTARLTGGNSRLEVVLVRLSTSDGQRIRIHTESFAKDGNSTGSDLAKIGAGAAIGAAIGAIAAGGKGAAIGAAAGTAAGAGTVLISHNRSIEIPVETRLTFRIQDPVTITERLN
jgi:hypothetical protein